MRNLLPSLILWLVLLAVPFQGFAAATMLPSVPAAGSCHDQMPAAAAHHDQAAGQDNDQHSHHAGAKCGNCSACCLGAAIVPAPAPELAPPGPWTASIPFAAAPLPSVHPQLPERPPRFPFV